MKKTLIAIVFATVGLTSFAATDAGNTAKPEAMKPVVTAKAEPAKKAVKPHKSHKKAAHKAKAPAVSASAPK